MLAFKPEASNTWESSKDNIIAYIRGEIEDVTIDDSIAFGIQDTQKQMNLFKVPSNTPCLYCSGL